MIGRRVATFDEIERPGDYCGPRELVNGKGEHIARQVLFLLPIHQGTDKFDRPTRGSGLHGVQEPPWRFRECPDGSLEIRESIACGRHDSGGEYWHGYLDEGHVWREC